MKYSFTFKTKFDINLFESLKQDISKTERAQWRIEKKKGNIEITIEAKDVIALKAFTYSITKLLEVYEKLKGIKNAR